MQRKRITLWALSLLTVALVVAACAPRAGGGQTTLLAGSEDISLDLPAIVIDFDSEGRPSIGDFALADIANEWRPACWRTSHCRRMWSSA